jgi:hypothetical protein
MFAASKSGSVAAKDAQFNYVTMLLHGNGTNGAQNNTFVDSSTNNFTITRNGNTTQGSFSPYGSNWSNYFDGTSGQYLNAPANAVFSLGTGDFTIEGWVYPTGTNTGAPMPIVEIRTNATNTTGFAFMREANALTLNVYQNGYKGASSNSLTFNAWNHVALVRSGNTWAYWINGVASGSFSNSTNITDGATTGPKIGGSTTAGEVWIGYMSNIRIVKGTAVYTTAFTPSATPLTVISGTSLLTCADNRFIDESTNNFTITVNGSPSVQRFNPFGAYTEYSTSVIGGSGYFDGTTDYLTVSQQTALSFGTGDFSIEAWVYPQATVGFFGVIDARNSGGGSGNQPWIFGLSDRTGYKVELFLSDAARYFGSITVPLNCWTHIAVSRVSGTLKSFVNGVVDYNASMTSTVNANGTTQSIGRIYDPAYITGYMTDVRVVKGSGYSSLTVPTAPLTAITNTQLLLSNTNGAIFDNAMMNDLETVGNAQISTSVKKYGTGSIYFDGSGDRLYEPSNQNFNFGTGDFTIELWAYPISQGGHGNSNNDCLIDFRPATGGGAYGTLYIFNSGTGVYWYANTGNRITGGAISNSVWTHIAICRSAGSTRLFLNGVQSGSTYTDSTNYLVSPIMIGEFNDGGGAGNFNGYIDDLRITKGVARYTAAFTPPTVAFSDVGPT